ncbi:MAG: Gfo/Idh/MocA family oxidoreductase [Chloroflexi bacterium]|nr:Gfo/Idh/MocA family oxidoreductase [Chloroflexota bacterium]MCL5107866.1 Gfo/Idh/MocA family oxidoreductase [Chloroflexota bacterium]
MSTPKSVRLGFIGAGFISDYHLAGLAAAGGAEFVIISSGSLAKASRQAQRFGIAHATADWREVLRRADVDAVVITTPDHTHAEIAIAAAEAGKAVLLQKPMAPTSAECERIVEAAERCSTLLVVSFMHRYFDEVVALRELLARGSLGDVLSLRIRNATPGPDWNAWFFKKELVRHGVVAQLGVHGIDLIRYLFGPIVAVKATVAQLQPERVLADGTRVVNEIDDHAFAIYRFRSGALGTQEMTFAEQAGCDRFRLEVYGSAGTAWLRYPSQGLALWAPAATGKKEWVNPELPNRPFGQLHHQHFLAQARGDEPPDGSARDGLRSMRVVEAIYRAAETGQEAEVE